MTSIVEGGISNVSEWRLLEDGLWFGRRLALSKFLRIFLHSDRLNSVPSYRRFDAGFVPFDKLLDVFWYLSQLKIAATAQFVGNIN